MANAVDRTGGQHAAVRDIAWGAVGIGFAIALAGTLAAGAWALGFAGKGAWWAANAGTLCLACGGFVAGHLARSAEPLNGAFVAVFYFGTVTLAVFAGEFFAVLPDPLPGLPRGDSTFFFVWPLAQLAAGTLGAMAGGWLQMKRTGRRRDENLS